MTTMSKQSILQNRQIKTSRERVIWIIIVSIQSIILLFYALPSSNTLHKQEVTFNGGNPISSQSGTCYCNYQPYCMCTPNLAIDAILISHEDPLQVYLVKRKDTNTLATMGGFVNVGETVEDAVQRELKEETNNGLQIMRSKEAESGVALFGVYSDPRRDGRRHTASVVYVVTVQETTQPHTGNHQQDKVEEGGQQQRGIVMKGGDDVKEIVAMDLKDIKMSGHLFFSDHWVILMDYYEKWLSGEEGNNEQNNGQRNYEQRNGDDNKEEIRTSHHLFRQKQQARTAGIHHNLPLGGKDRVVRSICFPR